MTLNFLFQAVDVAGGGEGFCDAGESPLSGAEGGKEATDRLHRRGGIQIVPLLFMTSKIDSQYSIQFAS